jgi:hypothetical protein
LVSFLGTAVQIESICETTLLADTFALMKEAGRGRVKSDE